MAGFVYDPYGAVIGQRSYGVHPPLKAGHRGLFAESLTVGTVGAPDADLGDPESTVVAWVDGRVLVPNERVVYHMRNRAYDPGPSGATAGRFLQRDPNASGAVLYGGGGGLGSHGDAPLAIMTGLDLAAHVADGVNTYGYLRGSPRGAGDPDGLRWDPFAEASAISAEHTWSGLVAINQAIFVAKEGQKAIQAYQRAAFQWSDLVMDRDEAILISMVGGTFFSKICFEAGTPVTLADGSQQSIESLPLGASVASAYYTAPGQTVVGSPHPDEHETIDPAMWRRVDLQLADAEHGTVRVALLRPIEWLHAIGLREGGEFEIHLQELGISGCARVVAIGPCPEIQKAPPGSQIVTGTFVTERAEILQVWLDGAGKPLGTTAAHPFYSDDRSAWVPAGELRTGEAVRTLTGKTTVERVERPGTQATVYNLEVHRAHTYFAGESRAWVHNECIGVGGSVLRVERRSDHLFVRVHFLELAKDIPGLFSRVREIARNAGTIGKVIVESGHVVNDDLLRKLLKLSEAGGRFFGGIVHRTGDRTFTIIFESAL